MTPEEGANFSERTTLRWSWDGTLGPDEYFDIRVWRGNEPHYGVGWSKTTEYLYDPRSKGGGDFFWSVAVIRGRDGKWIADLSPEATSRAFVSTVGGGGGGDNGRGGGRGGPPPPGPKPTR